MHSPLLIMNGRVASLSMAVAAFPAIVTHQTG